MHMLVNKYKLITSFSDNKVNLTRYIFAGSCILRDIKNRMMYGNHHITFPSNIAMLIGYIMTALIVLILPYCIIVTQATDTPGIN